MTNEEVKKYLFSIKDDKYKQFHQALIPNISEDLVIGVRVPLLRSLAKKLANDCQYISNVEPIYHEEIMLYGLSIGYTKQDINAKLSMYDDFLQYACSWSITDTVFQGVKDFGVKANRQVVFEYFSSKAFSNKEYIARSGIVVMMRYFLTDEYITQVINIISKINSDKYYVNMALAWLVAEMLAKYFDKGLALIKEGILSEFVHNNAIKKANESYKITSENKKLLLTYKR